MRLRDPEAFSSVMDGPRSGLLSLAGDKKCHCLQTLRCLVSFSLLSPCFLQIIDSSSRFVNQSYRKSLTAPIDRKTLLLKSSLSLKQTLRLNKSLSPNSKLLEFSLLLPPPSSYSSSRNSIVAYHPPVSSATNSHGEISGGPICLLTALVAPVGFVRTDPIGSSWRRGRTPVVTPHILSSIVFYRVIPEILFLCRGRSRDIKALHMPLKTLLVLHYLLSVLSDGFLMLLHEYRGRDA
ncbi:hypothetical protein IGI04_039846 [Brassica rapa subsp. trilocularis]|uniref:Uncharacterized protein n=1 Tax=Brassica rapa subsp. trilocularis TaxID=1813537 RepID=A0ABQ7KP00_BRACM|nr:hypothetical protein IGI04_039846 [Brassica rapa subsp. trilocularis]